MDEKRSPVRSHSQHFIIHTHTRHSGRRDLLEFRGTDCLLCQVTHSTLPCFRVLHRENGNKYQRFKDGMVMGLFIINYASSSQSESLLAIENMQREAGNMLLNHITNIYSQAPKTVITHC